MKSKKLKLFAGIFLLHVTTVVKSQTIFFNEDFKTNENNWQSVGEDPSESVSIDAGRYDLETISKSNWHFFTIQKEFPSEPGFIIESVITRLPTRDSYELLDVQEVKRILNDPAVTYQAKYYNSVWKGLDLIEKHQKAGIRFHFIRSDDRFSWLYANSETALEIKENKHIANAISFATSKYKEGYRNIVDHNQRFGLIWGCKNNANLFSFNVVPDLQLFQVVSIIGGQWTNVIKWSKSDQILTGNSANKLTVSHFDGTLFFLINDEVVGKAPFQQFHGNGIGFWVDPETHISVDNLLIKTYESKQIPVASNEAYSSSGTGLLISELGYITTNYHVVADATAIEVDLLLNGRKISVPAKTVQIDKNNDLAVIKIQCDNLPKPTFGLKYSTIDVGSSVYAMGYPLLSLLGDELKITDGIISSRTGFQGDISCYQMSAAIQPGNSGGPLFDKQGYLIGITNARVKGTENVGYAIKASYLQNLTELLNEKVVIPSTSALENISFTEQIKQLSPFVVVIKVK